MRRDSCPGIRPVVEEGPGIADKEYVEQVQAISARVGDVAEYESGRDRRGETFKSARLRWVGIVMIGLILLMGASAMAVLAVKRTSEGSQWALEMGLVAGPGHRSLSLRSSGMIRDSPSSWSRRSKSPKGTFGVW